MSRPSWREYGLGIAVAVSVRADCARRKVGAVILDRHNRVVATGYNGAPPGRKGCLEGGCPRGLEPYSVVPAFGSYDNCISNHAELNALLYADRSRIEGGTMYITDEPCYGCRKAIANSGLQFVCWPDHLVNVEDIL